MCVAVPQCESLRIEDVHVVAEAVTEAIEAIEVVETTEATEGETKATGESRISALEVPQEPPTKDRWTALAAGIRQLNCNGPGSALRPTFT